MIFSVSDSFVSHDIQVILEEMLSSAIAQTPAQKGLIGLVDEDFTNLTGVRLIQQDYSTILPAENIGLKQIPEIRKDALEPRVIEEVTLTSLLSLPETFIWHYVKLTEVSQEHYVLLILHMNSPQELTNQDIQILSGLNDQYLEKLQGAFLYEDLQDAIQAKNEFISFISHELKNPLTVINSYADMMLRGMTGEVTSQQKEYLETIIQNVKRMNKFIEDLSDQSHIETQTLQLVFESISAKQVIVEVLQSYEAQITEKTLYLNKKIADDMPDMWCDRIRVIQILSNILSNAIKYTPESGTVEIGAEHSLNKWDPYGAAEVIRFWVRDTGYGISVKEQSRIFERFFRGSASRLLSVPGTGLGLAISKELIDLHYGKITLQSDGETGSEFIVWLPMPPK